MPSKLILFLALICPFFTIAQANYKEGYVINNSGDTLKGFINYREWNSNPSQIAFRQSTGNPDMDITSANTREVVITGFETYDRFEVSLSLNPVNFDQLTDTSTKNDRNQNCFFKKDSEWGSFGPVFLYRQTKNPFLYSSQWEKYT